MHLGHLAGPYLKMDILRRKAERGGGKAFIVSGSDVFESYVELKADQLGIETEQVCNTFHPQIIKDFEALDIRFDFFLNPLDEEYRARFFKREKELMQQLVDAGVVEERTEDLIYDPINKRFLNGCWIKGVCPNCGSGTGSYLCETCGTHYRPVDIFNAENYPAAQVIKGTALYLRLDTRKLFEKVEKMEISKEFADILKRYIELQGPYIRLTTPQSTGVEWEWGNGKKQVFFTYSALLFFSVFCADICQERFGLPVHPFDTSSEFITIASFGIDNAIPYLAGVLAGGMHLTGLKPFDHYFTNHFYYLNGEKFSTSRLHVIWGSDIVQLANVQPDEVRYYLAKQNPELEKKNFDISEFISVVNEELFTRYNNVLRNALELLTAKPPAGPDEDLYNDLLSLIETQNSFLDPPSFNLADALRPVESWITLFEGWSESRRSAYSYWWLKGFALLAAPFMPHISGHIWNMLSDKHEIKLENFFSPGKVSLQPLASILFKEVTYSQMEKCLPESIKNKSVKTN
jgi:methionyl-tRNA synthetase